MTVISGSLSGGERVDGTPVLPPLRSCTIAMVGLGYVGLPLALEFARSSLDARAGLPLQRRVIGFDIDRHRVEELRRGVDRTRETRPGELESAERLELSCEAADLAQADVFIITVPTPIDDARRPDLGPLERASAMVGQALAVRATQAHSTPLVVFESTVYPGATEEFCVPILERHSGLVFNAPGAAQGFVCGYSPERINPGDREHRLTTIIKVTSGSTPEAAAWIDALYGSIITAGTHRAASIKVAEAAKVIENTQRDLNIALVNELAMIFERIGIDTLDVLEAAGTKWNFLPFRPGLVGGHCIGVDPLYLTHKAEQLGYYPQVVLAGRRINDGMAAWLAQRLLQEMARRGMVIAAAPLLVLGLTFKENCPDLRNTRVLDLIHDLELCGSCVTVVDPWVDAAAARVREGVEVLDAIPAGARFAAVVVAVAHRQFLDWPAERWRQLLLPDAVLMDLKGVVPRELDPIRL
ncbi:MAG: nucleotide sugar dehydrogenase [Cyanobium sp.]